MAIHRICLCADYLSVKQVPGHEWEIVHVATVQKHSMIQRLRFKHSVISCSNGDLQLSLSWSIDSSPTTRAALACHTCIFGSYMKHRGVSALQSCNCEIRLGMVFQWAPAAAHERAHMTHTHHSCNIGLSIRPSPAATGPWDTRATVCHDAVTLRHAAQQPLHIAQAQQQAGSLDVPFLELM